MESRAYEEIWVNTEDGQAMVALVNSERGWLMYLRESGDPGFSSRNPDYVGPEDATIEYELSNGQRDEYPASWALPIDVVRRALAYFESRKEPPLFIRWHNDSHDGAVIRYEDGAE